MAGILRRQVNSVTGPWDAEPRPAADPALVAAYPGERQRADAARWLGWLARLAECGRLEWWLIPAWVSVGRVRQVRRRFLYLVAIAVVVLTVGAEDGYADAWWVNTYSFLAFLALCVEIFRHRRRKRREKRDGPVPLVPVPPARPRRPGDHRGRRAARRPACLHRGRARLDAPRRAARRVPYRLGECLLAGGGGRGGTPGGRSVGLRRGAGPVLPAAQVRRVRPAGRLVARRLSAQAGGCRRPGPAPP